MRTPLDFNLSENSRNSKRMWRALSAEEQKEHEKSWGVAIRNGASSDARKKWQLWDAATTAMKADCYQKWNQEGAAEATEEVAEAAENTEAPKDVIQVSSAINNDGLE